MRYGSRSGRPGRSVGGGPPAWLVFILGAALIFGLFYLWQGVSNFVRTGGLGVVESTERAVVVSTATAQRSASFFSTDDRTPAATRTPVPPCQDFVVSVPNAIVREGPAASAGIITSFNQGQSVCVLADDPTSGWYSIDLTPDNHRLDLAYMHQSVIRAVNPTPKPTITVTPLPTVTPVPTQTPSATAKALPSPTAHFQASATPTATATPLPTATDIRQSA